MFRNEFGLRFRLRLRLRLGLWLWFSGVGLEVWIFEELGEVGLEFFRCLQKGF